VTVKPGETLSEIADRYAISVKKLMALNGISKADHVEVGQKLKVPGAGGRGSAAGGVVATGKVTVRDGDTLSEIADRQGMSLAQLMALNGISKADHVEVGQSLKVTGRVATASTASSAAPAYRKGASVHVVRSGESLSEIAEGYGVPMGRLVAINSIPDPDHVEVGSQLKLKGEAPAAPRPRPVVTAVPRPQPQAAAPAPAARERPVQTVAARPEPEAAAVPRSSQQPVVTQATASAAAAATVSPSWQSAQTAAATRPFNPATSTTAITPSRSTSTASITAAATAATVPIAAVTPSPRVRPATATVTPRPVAPKPTVAAAAPAPAATVATSSWRRYGPLQVDWSNWQPMGGSLVAPILNAKGDTLYLAINCGARKMNATSVAGDWRTWDDPQADFERRLVNDLCTSRG
jgi:hypothetical protein